MDLSKIFDKPMKIFISTILILMTILCFFNTFIFAAENEELSFTRVDGIHVSSTRNYFQAYSGASVGYITMEPGYIYHISFVGSGGNRQFCLSSAVPVANGTYNFLTSLEPNGSFDYLCSDRQLLIMAYSWYNEDVFVTREKVVGMSGAVIDLVSSLAPTDFWNVFSQAIPYISIVVLVSFGLFYIFHMIKEISQGKEKM